MYTGEDIQKVQEFRKNSIAKAFDNDIEKGHNVGDVHSNGKWVWTQLPSGKFDWRGIKTTSTKQPTQNNKGKIGENYTESHLQNLVKKENFDARHFEEMNDAELKYIHGFANANIFNSKLTVGAKKNVNDWFKGSLNEMSKRNKPATPKVKEPSIEDLEVKVGIFYVKELPEYKDYQRARSAVDRWQGKITPLNKRDFDRDEKQLASSYVKYKNVLTKLLDEKQNNKEITKEEFSALNKHFSNSIDDNNYQGFMSHVGKNKQVVLTVAYESKRGRIIDAIHKSMNKSVVVPKGYEVDTSKVWSGVKNDFVSKKDFFAAINGDDYYTDYNNSEYYGEVAYKVIKK